MITEKELDYPSSFLIFSILLLILSSLVSCNTDSYDEEPIETCVDDRKSNSPNSNDEDNIPSRSGNEELNLLENGGLEEWSLFITPEMPKKWSLPSNEYVKRNYKVVFEGLYSAKMQSQESGKTARLEQKIQVFPYSKIRIRFHYYIEQWKAKGARTYCYFRTRSAESSSISADELKTFYDKNTFYIIRGGGYGLTYLPHNLNKWQEFDETIEVPPTANYFVFGINSYNGTILYVDDCWVIDVTINSTAGIKPVKV